MGRAMGGGGSAVRSDAGRRSDEFQSEEEEAAARMRITNPAIAKGKKNFAILIYSFDPWFISIISAS